MSRSLTLSAAAILSLLFSSADAQNIEEFHHVPAGTVRTATVSGNLLYIGGNFGYVGPETGRGVPIDALTGQTPSSIAEVGGTSIWAVAPDGAGGWYIGGVFTDVDGTPRSNIAHILADNTVSDWNPSANGEVRALAVDGSTVYVGGSFTSIGGQPRNCIAALDATTGNATAWDPNASGSSTYVLALAVSGSTVYAGGQFTTIGGQARSCIAALDATTGNATAWNPSATCNFPCLFPYVKALAVSGSTVYAGGRFISIGFQLRNNLAALDVTTGAATAWNPNSNSAVGALEVSGSTVYAGGDFVTIGGQTRPGIAALDAVTGLATPWNPSPAGNRTVWALAVDGSTVYAGGDFTTIGGQPRNRIAALDASTGAATTWNPSASWGVYALAVSGSMVYAGGGFTSVGGALRRGLAALDLTTKEVTAWDPKVTAGNDPVEVRTLALSGPTLYAGGHFTGVGGVPRIGIAAVDVATGTVTAWNPGMSGEVSTLALSGSTVYAGGTFSSMGGQSRSNIAAVDMSTGTATAWNPNANGSVLTLAVDGSTVYTGGFFTSIGGQSRARIAALDVASGLATPWDPSASGSVNALAVSGSTVYAGGGFSSFIGGAPRSFLAALDAATGSATPWNPAANASVLALALSGSIVYAGGGFTSVGGQSRAGLAALDMTTGSALSWNPNLGTPCWDLEVSGSTVYAGGGFPARIVAIDDAVVGVPAPGSPSLAQLSFANHPNPFRETTLLQFRLARETEVTLGVYDVSGREVARLADRKRFGPGPHDVPMNGQALPAGLYVCLLRAGEQSAARRVVRIP